MYPPIDFVVHLHSLKTSCDSQNDYREFVLLRCMCLSVCVGMCIPYIPSKIFLQNKRHSTSCFFFVKRHDIVMKVAWIVVLYCGNRITHQMKSLFVNFVRNKQQLKIKTLIQLFKFKFVQHITINVSLLQFFTK